MPRDTSAFEPHVSRVVSDLAAEFKLPREEVEPIVAETFESLSEARIKAFVPILARRHARSHLRRRRGAA
jgi:hypothetical protein